MTAQEISHDRFVRGIITYTIVLILLWSVLSDNPFDELAAFLPCMGTCSFRQMREKDWDIETYIKKK
jgi:hypothetical protein